MVTNTNHKYAGSSLNYYVIIMVQNFKKIQTRKFPKKFAFTRHEMPN